MKTMRRRSSDLLERVSSLPRDLKSRRIDRDKGILYGVKVLGTTSTNDGGRKYLPEAIQRAAKLYEGISVRIDHPDDPEQQRSSNDVFGWLKNVRVANDGCLYADLHYFKSHPFASRLVEAVERNPRAFGLSHNASGETEQKQGMLLVHEITEVRSVDLVADPATTTGLFESKQPGKSHKSSTSTVRHTHMKLREWFDRSKLLPVNRKTITRLFEGGYMDPEQPVTEADMPPDESEPMTSDPVASDPADMDPESALRAGFRAAMIAVIDDNTLDVKAKLARLKELVSTSDRLLASGQEIPEEEEMELGDDEEPLEESHDEDEEINVVEGEEPTDKKDTMLECEGMGKPFTKNMKESKQIKLTPAQELNQLRREKVVRTLCESESYNPSPAVFNALCKLSSTEDRLALINETRRSSHKARTSKSIVEGKSNTNLDVMSLRGTEDAVKFLTSSH